MSKQRVNIGNHIFEPYSLGSLNIGIDTQMRDNVAAVDSANLREDGFYDALSSSMFSEDSFEQYRQESLQHDAYLMRDGVLVFNE